MPDTSTGGFFRDPAQSAQARRLRDFGLSRDDDSALTAWMRDRLQIAVWPTDRTRALVDVEADVLREWNPPINIAKVDHQWRSFLRAERKSMADQAWRWQPPAE